MSENWRATLEICSACGAICGLVGDVRAAHESGVSSCAEEGGRVVRVEVGEVSSVAGETVEKIVKWVRDDGAKDVAVAVALRGDAQRAVIAEAIEREFGGDG